MEAWRAGIVACLLVASVAGCIGGDDEQTANESLEAQSMDEDAEGTIETEVFPGEVVFSLATPALSFNGNVGPSEGPYIFGLERPANATGYVLELVWDASTPASENLDLWVRDTSEGNVPPEDPTDPLAEPPAATATGSSPLKLVVEEGDLDEGTDYDLIVRAPSDMGAGLVVKQPFDLHVSTFVDQPVDEEHSAIEDASSS